MIARSVSGNSKPPKRKRSVIGSKSLSERGDSQLGSNLQCVVRGRVVKLFKLFIKN